VIALAEEVKAMDISAKRLLASMVAGVMIASAFAGFLVGGIALAQPQPPCPLDEGFSGSWLPSGWAEDDWDLSSSDAAGGTAPEARLYGDEISGDGAYLDSKPVDTSAVSSLTLQFKSFILDYCCSYDDGQDEYCDGACGSYNCSVYTRADAADSWTDVTPWSSPIPGDVGPRAYSVDISSDIGSATQVRFEFDGYDYAINYWAVDDVKICGPGPDLVVSITSVTFDEDGNFTVSYNVTNQGTALAGESGTNEWVDDTVVADLFCPSLNPGESYSETLDPEACPPVPCTGNFRVKLCADDYSNVAEIDEDNNCDVDVVEPPCPKIVDPKQDSLYIDVDGNSAASPGDILQYVAEIRNEGNAAATGVTFNDTVDANTILMCADPYAPITSQGSITSCNSAPGGSLAADLGDIGPKDKVTVIFYVKVGYGEFDRVSNQGLVTGDNLADDPTDDPDTSEPDDPTDTLISLPGPTPPPGVPTVNHWGIVAMITLFAGLLVWAMRRRLSAS
jgi:uncharacterized repeat protein (TIGR01451 family)